MYDQILIPIDDSACSQKAIQEGLQFAKHFGAEVMFLHVTQDPMQVAFAHPDGYAYVNDLYDSIQKAAQQLLSKVEEQAKQIGVKASTKLIEKRFPADVICAEAENVDLVIMATHGRRGFRRMALGSVTEEALRRSSVPYLIVHCPDAR